MAVVLLCGGPTVDFGLSGAKEVPKNSSHAKGTASFTISRSGKSIRYRLTAHGLPTVTLGCGQQHIHTTGEVLHIPSFLQACEIALNLATATSSPRSA